MARVALALAVTALSSCVVLSTPGAAQSWSIDNLTAINQAVQDALIWTGHYDGLTDGAMGEKSIRAISAFQSDQGYAATGDLPPEQKLRLFQIADDARRRLDWQLVRWRSETTSGSRYTSPDGAIEVLVKRYPVTQTMRTVFEEVVNSLAMTNVTMRVLRRDAMFVGGETETRSHYYTAKLDGDEIIGLGIITPRDSNTESKRLVVALANAFHTGTPNYMAVVEKLMPLPKTPAVAGYVQRAPGSPAPPAQTQNQNAHLIEHAVLVPIVQDVLKSMGVERYKILPAETDHDVTVFWTYEGGGLSSLMAARPLSGVSLDAASNDALNSASRGCKGEFASRKDAPRYERGSEFRDVSALCRTGNEVVETQFNVMELPSGVILRFAHTLITNGPAAPALAHDEQRKLENAVWTAVDKLSGTK